MEYIKSFGFVNILIKEEEGRLVKLDFTHKDETKNYNSFAKNVFGQVDEYFKGKRFKFDLDLYLYGSEFQKRVWQELMKVPYGETRSYLDIAMSINKPKASRAVGMANNKNPIAIIIPCHRIISTNRKLTGYRGGLDLKASLLELEGQKLENDMVL